MIGEGQLDADNFLYKHNVLADIPGEGDTGIAVRASAEIDGQALFLECLSPGQQALHIAADAIGAKQANQ